MTTTLAARLAADQTAVRRARAAVDALPADLTPKHRRRAVHRIARAHGLTPRPSTGAVLAAVARLRQVGGAQ